MSEIKVGDTVWVRGAVEEIAADGTWQVRIYPEGSHLTDAAWLAPFVALVEDVGSETLADDLTICAEFFRAKAVEFAQQGGSISQNDWVSMSVHLFKLAAAMRGEGAANG